MNDATETKKQNGRPKGVGKYEKSDPKPKGSAFYRGVAKAWCYLCKEEHSWDDCERKTA